MILPIHKSEFSMENQIEMPFYAPILDLPENKTMMYGGIAAVIIIGVCFWFFVGRKKGKFHAQGKEMMNKAKVKVQNAPTAVLVTICSVFVTTIRHKKSEPS